MYPDTESNQSIGFAGLASHEKNTIECVQRIYPHRLSSVRDIAEPHAASIIFADPQTSEGQAALLRSDVYVIAIQDRRQPMEQGADDVLYRPLRPRAVLDSLNRVEQRPSAALTPKLVSESGELHQILRNVIADDSNRQPIVLSEQGQPWLVVDPARDRIRGHLEHLNEERLLTRDRHVFNRVTPEEASRILESEQEAPLYRTMWKLAYELGGRARLFGNDHTALIKFERWPNFSETRVAGKFLRAVSLIRHNSFTVSDARMKTGLSEPALLVLLNGSWLTGELCLDSETERGASKVPSKPGGVNSSVLARIRSRLSGA
ncbi:hypothetical protein MARLIPOL_07184 [Marinobacter lipolyticus SM19]|uniref:Uncharacterized protein n=1 Tax=Marinobacter lipolyticus SM19 TaxID=1318628 RepID=R8B1Q5_9GAMM|nr:hypothetical protein [Marinobacter lipolyticus]EON92516.1 hypothetical protein MARLIPOL_07184 [Marinobacter lipolyticus SM19]